MIAGRRLTWLLVVALAGCGAPLAEEWPPGYYCGVGDDEKMPAGSGTSAAGTWTGAIVNGVADPDPAVADLSDRQRLAIGALVSPDGGGVFCTGTVVGDNAVLTASHCVQDWRGTIPPSDVRFAVGPDVGRPLHVFGVSQVHANPLSDGVSAPHDNAVLVLSGLVSELYPEILPVEINTEPLERVAPAVVGRDVQNVGYGSTVPGGGGGNTRQWWTVESITELRMFEYTTYGGGVSAVCFGDSGGPGMITFPDGQVRVIGTLNGGDADCVSYDQWARTDVDADWIASYVVAAAGCRLGAVGRCVEDVAEWCVGEAEADLRRQDCEAIGRICGVDRDGNHRCLAGTPCGDVTWHGRCDGDVAVWCEDRLLRRRHCAPCGQVCRFVDSSVGYYCAAPVTTP